MMTALAAALALGLAPDPAAGTVMVMQPAQDLFEDH